MKWTTETTLKNKSAMDTNMSWSGNRNDAETEAETKRKRKRTYKKIDGDRNDESDKLRKQDEMGRKWKLEPQRNGDGQLKSRTISRLFTTSLG